MSNSPPESARGLWYSPKVNRFKDDTGLILNNLSEFFPTWKLDVWKKGKDYGILKDKTGEIWELFYDQDTYESMCKHKCNKCPNRCEIYDLVRDEY